MSHRFVAPLLARALLAPASRAGAHSIVIRGTVEGEATRLQGAGAAFPAVQYSRWFNDYVGYTGVQVNYQPVGSGAGIRGITDRTADFAGSDAPMTNAQLAQAGAEVFHIPTALGAVVVTYNIPGFDQALFLTPDMIAGIFLGEISMWNDPRLTVINDGLVNVGEPIRVVRRSDASGTTSILADYLSTVSETWRTQLGRSTALNWPTGIGANGNAGVAGEVSLNPYSVGYVELIYALQNQLGYAWVQNRAGNWIEPNTDSVTDAAAGVANSIAPDLQVSIVNAPGDNAYPISGFTWLLVYREQSDYGKAVALTRMLWWATHKGQSYNARLGYAPVPAAIVERTEQMIWSITFNGAAAFPGY